MRATVEHEDGTLGNAFTLSAVPPDSRLLVRQMEAGRWMHATDGRVLVVSRRVVADEPRLRVGKTVLLAIGGRSQPWTVIGEIDAGITPVAYVPRATLAELTGGIRVDRAVVRSTLRGGPSQLELMQRLRTTLAERGLTVQTGQMMAEARAVTEDHLLMVAGFLGVMGQLMIVVGGLALASTMGMAVLERTREIGVLRAIGARHGSIYTMVQAEGLVISLLGWLLAIPLSVPMSVLLGRAFGRIMLPVAVTYVPEPRGVLFWLGIAVVVSVAAGTAPAWRAMRITTKAALAYE